MKMLNISPNLLAMYSPVFVVFVMATWCLRRFFYAPRLLRCAILNSRFADSPIELRVDRDLVGSWTER